MINHWSLIILCSTRCKTLPAVFLKCSITELSLSQLNVKKTSVHLLCLHSAEQVDPRWSEVPFSQVCNRAGTLLLCWRSSSSLDIHLPSAVNVVGIKQFKLFSVNPNNVQKLEWETLEICLRWCSLQGQPSQLNLLGRVRNLVPVCFLSAEVTVHESAPPDEALFVKGQT